jgi:hypothetical protein
MLRARSAARAAGPAVEAGSKRRDGPSPPASPQPAALPFREWLAERRAAHACALALGKLLVFLLAHSMRLAPLRAGCGSSPVLGGGLMSRQQGQQGGAGRSGAGAVAEPWAAGGATAAGGAPAICSASAAGRALHVLRGGPSFLNPATYWAGETHRRAGDLRGKGLQGLMRGTRRRRVVRPRPHPPPAPAQP